MTGPSRRLLGVDVLTAVSKNPRDIKKEILQPALPSHTWVAFTESQTFECAEELFSQISTLCRCLLQEDTA